MIYGAIFGKDLNTAQERLRKLEEDYSLMAIASRTRNATIFGNGDKWVAYKYDSLMAHGYYRYNIIYIDRRIPDEFVYWHIKGCLGRPPFSAFNYF